MIFAVVLAGGVGSRMGNAEKPKQFLTIGGKPVLIHTIERFFVHPGFEKVIVPCVKEWKAYTSNLVEKYFPDQDRIVVIEGGSTRNETIMNAIDYIDQAGQLNEETIIVTHDSVRPFVTSRMIDDNIEAVKKYGACNTVNPATDTIVESQDGKVISNIPDRRQMFQGQTPQSFHAVTLKKAYESLTEEEKEILTDACKILVMKQVPVAMVLGEVYNIKITYPYDMRVAESLLKMTLE